MKPSNSTFLKSLMDLAKVPESLQESLLGGIDLVVQDEVTNARYNLIISQNK